VRIRNISLTKTLLLLLVLLTLIPGTLGCLGTRTVPIGWSGGTIDDGNIFLGSMEGTLVGIDTSTHTRLWVDVTLDDDDQPIIYGSPATGNGLVYLASYTGKIFAVNPGSGVIRWVYPRTDALDPIVSAPVFHDGKVYFGCSDGKVYALDADTGDLAWEAQTGEQVWATPVIANDTLYIGSFDKKFYALNTSDGSTKWEPFQTEGAIISPAIIYNDTVYFGSFDRHIYALDATNGSLKWQSEVTADNWFWTSPVISNGNIYAGCLDGKIYILDVETGTEVIPAIDLESPVSSSPVLSDNTAFFASEDGKVYVIDTTTNESRLLNDLEEKINAALCADDEAVYVHTQTNESLFALNKQTGVVMWKLELSSK